jgi:prepilin-type N-terminal cleavage/methylation domain-containing protein
MKHLSQNISKKQGGYSLVELSIALAIVSVILVGGLMGTRQILMTNNVNNQLKESAQVIAKITKNFQKQSDTKEATVDNLAPVGVWPSERASKDTGGKWAIRGVMGGSAEHVFANKAQIVSMAASQGFMYYIHNVPSAACADLVNGLDSMAYAIYAGDAAKLTTIDGATPGSDFEVVKAADTNQVNQAKLAKGCDNSLARVSIIAAVRM